MGAGGREHPYLQTDHSANDGTYNQANDSAYNISYRCSHSSAYGCTGRNTASGNG